MSDHDNEMAEKIAEALMRRIYQEIGKSVARKLFWVAIAAAIAFGIGTGLLKVPTP